MYANSFVFRERTMTEKISISEVKFKHISNPSSGELSEKSLRKCNFCEKVCEIGNNLLLTKLSGPGNFYCSFCLRNDFHTKKNKDILILSFRSVIGYFYFRNYMQISSGKKLWLSEIEDFIASHVAVGVTNPLFLYDPETMLWFVNFSKVGDSKKKIPLEEIHKTILNILTCFNLSEMVCDISLASFYEKYKEAVEVFYRKRYRPDRRKMLIPTLRDTGASESKYLNGDKLRNFTFSDLKIKN